MLQKKAGHVLFHVFFLDCFNVNADIKCFSKILVKNKNKLLNNQAEQNKY